MLTIASYFTQQAYDRALLDDAYLVASHVRQKTNATEVDIALSLSAQEMSTVLFDQSESMFFAVLRLDGSLVAGHAGLHPTLSGVQSAPQFEELNYQNKHLRSVTLFRDQPTPFVVVMAQTTTTKGVGCGCNARLKKTWCLCLRSSALWVSAMLATSRLCQCLRVRKTWNDWVRPSTHC
jgi:two-component system sensor histidine kinase TctE